MSDDPRGNYVQLKYKAAGKGVRYYISSLGVGDCYTATNIRDLSTWVLVARDVPEKLVHAWGMGDESALDGYRS